MSAGASLQRLGDSTKWSSFKHCTEMCLDSFISGGVTTMAVIDPMAKRKFVHYLKTNGLWLRLLTVYGWQT